MRYKYRLISPAPEVKLLLRTDKNKEWEFMLLEAPNNTDYGELLIWQKLTKFDTSIRNCTIMDFMFGTPQ